jgi:hypothetical protein
MDMDNRKNPAAKRESLIAADKESTLISPNSVHRNAGTQPLKTRDKRNLPKKSVFSAFTDPGTALMPGANGYFGPYPLVEEAMVMMIAGIMGRTVTGTAGMSWIIVIITSLRIPRGL